MRRSVHHCEVPPHAGEELVACAVWYSSTSKGKVPHIAHRMASATEYRRETARCAAAELATVASV